MDPTIQEYVQYNRVHKLTEIHISGSYTGPCARFCILVYKSGPKQEYSEWTQLPFQYHLLKKCGVWEGTIIPPFVPLCAILSPPTHWFTNLTSIFSQISCSWKGPTILSFDSQMPPEATIPIPDFQKYLASERRGHTCQTHPFESLCVILDSYFFILRCHQRASF